MLEIVSLATTGNNGVTTAGAIIQQALMIGRGGAVLMAASTVSTLAAKQVQQQQEQVVAVAVAVAAAALQIRGGAAAAAKKNTAVKKRTPIVHKRTPGKKTPTKRPVTKPIKSQKLHHQQPLLNPRAKAVLFMAVAMSFHYLGYSLARPITISLFTSKELGYGGIPAAFPFAMAFVSPMSLWLLLWYGRTLDALGPGGALSRSTLLCAMVMSISALAIRFFDSSGTKVLGIAAAKLVSGPLFVFRESYVQLLTSQYWSFMASAMTPSQSATWFGPIAGLTSITSALAGFGVSSIIGKIGIAYALMGTGLTLLASLVASRLAYGVAETHGFSPENKHVTRSPLERNNDHREGDGMFSKATKLFQRVPILRKLFIEILASQGLATVLNVVFVARLQRSIPDDAERAGWVGKFFSTINVITMILQFGILPPMLTFLEPKIMWRVVPLIALVFSAYQAMQEDPSLYIVSATLLVMKVLEYSARRMLDEMVFVPLDFESRFVGKEVIGVFGYRFGKSLMSLGLSGLTAIFGNFGIQEYSILSALVNLGWWKSAWSLSNDVPTRKEAQEMYNIENKVRGGRPILKKQSK